MNNIKSATTAGLLGIFLGSIGAHDFYLGDKKKGIIHVCLAASGIIVSIIVSAILPMILSYWTLLKMASFLGLLNGLAALVVTGNGIWGFVEGIIILTQGDAGLAQKGYRVAGPVNNVNTMNNNNSVMNNNMNGGNGQPVANQPANDTNNSSADSNNTIANDAGASTGNSEQQATSNEDKDNNSQQA